MYQFILWSAKEDRILTSMWEQGALAQSIATELKRTISSVRNRARFLELPARRGGRRNLHGVSSRRTYKMPERRNVDSAERWVRLWLNWRAA